MWSFGICVSWFDLPDGSDGKLRIREKNWLRQCHTRVMIGRASSQSTGESEPNTFQGREVSLSVSCLLLPFSLNLLVWHWLIKLNRFQVYISIMHQLYIVLCFHHRKSSLPPSPLTCLYPLLPSPTSLSL